MIISNAFALSINQAGLTSRKPIAVSNLQIRAVAKIIDAHNVK